MIIAILVILVIFSIMAIRRLDFLVYAATDGLYCPWYRRIKEILRDFLFDKGPIFRS